MNKPFLFAAVVIFAAIGAQAGDKTQTGTIISENSVSCGSKVEKRKKPSCSARNMSSGRTLRTIT